MLPKERGTVLLSAAVIVLASMVLGWLVSQRQFLSILAVHSVGNFLFILFSVVISRDKQGNILWLAPPFLLSGIFMLQYVIPGYLLGVGVHDLVWPHRWDRGNVIIAADILLWVAWASFLAGYTAGTPKAVLLLAQMGVAGSRSMIVGYVCAAVAALSIAVSILKSGGYFSLLESGRTAQGTGIFNILSYLYLPAIALLHAFHQYVIATIVALIASAFYLAIQARLNAFEPFLFIAYLISLTTTTKKALKRSFLFLGLVAIGGLLLAPFPLISSRYGLEMGLKMWFVMIKQWVSQLIVGGIMTGVARIEQLSIVLENVPENMPYFWGVPIVKGLLGPLDKYLLGERTTPWDFLLTGIILGLGEAASFSFGSSGIAELYVNWSWVGVVVGMFLYGFMARTLYTVYRLNVGHNFGKGILLYAVTSWLLYLTIAKGIAVMGFIYAYALWLVPILVSLRKHRFPARVITACEERCPVS